MYKKYELVPQSFTQGVAVDGVVKVTATYKSIDPEKSEDSAYMNYRSEAFELEFSESEEISWSSVAEKVNNLSGVVSTY